MITMNWDIANHLLAFIISIISIGGVLIGLVVRAVTLTIKVNTLEAELADTNQTFVEYRADQKKELVQLRVDTSTENLRLEAKFETLQSTVGQVLQGVARIQGVLEANHNKV